MSEAAAYLAEAGAKGAAPALARLTAALAERFGVLVTEKGAAELVPVLGAAGGATINLLSWTTSRTWPKGTSRYAP